MAVRDHSLDSPITQAAMQEFLANGYEKASLRKIAAQAGVTVGAIYTRCKTKDQLFCSLVEPLLQRIGEAFSAIRADYQSGQGRWDPKVFSASMQYESQTILHLLFDDYDRAVLLLCRSTGSSLEHFLDQLVEKKIEETVAFFQAGGLPQLEPGVLKLLIKEQFHMYFQIIDEGYDLDTARRLMDAAMRYHAGGWMAILSGPSRK